MNYTRIQPFSDEKMIYDFVEHKYYLTERAILEELGLNFHSMPDGNDANPSTMARRFIRKVTNNVYLYLYEDIFNPRWTEYELATIAELREEIFKMLIEQAEYNAQSGFAETYSGLDIYKGAAMDRYKINDAIICPMVEKIAFKMQPSIGRCLKYAGTYGGYAPDYVDAEGNSVY